MRSRADGEQRPCSQLTPLLEGYELRRLEGGAGREGLCALGGNGASLQLRDEAEQPPKKKSKKKPAAKKPKKKRGRAAAAKAEEAASEDTRPERFCDAVEPLLIALKGYYDDAARLHKKTTVNLFAQMRLWESRHASLKQRIAALVQRVAALESV